MRISARVAVAAVGALAVAGLTACGSAAPVPGVAHTPGGARPASTPASAGTTAGTTASTAVAPGSPVVGAEAFAGQGRLAFVSGNRLYVLDGSVAGQPATLHAVAAGKVPGALAWSPDGQWLAFLVGAPSADGALIGGALWLAGPDGQNAHQLLPDVSTFAWSPKRDTLAVIAGDVLATLVPGQAPQTEVAGQGLTGPPAWSPDGEQIAFSVIHFGAEKSFLGSDLETVMPGTTVSIVAHSGTDALLVDGWWPDGQGLFAWSDPQDSASLAADGVPLVAYPLGGGAPQTLASTLVHSSFAVPNGDGVTLVTGGDRYLWHAKTIEYCDVFGQCSPAMNATPPPVNLDPAWAPGPGTQEPLLAFVHGATESAAGFSQQVLDAWYRTRQLWYWAGTGGNPLPVTRAGTGVAAPTWSANAQYILYVRDNALWLIPMFAPDGMPATGPAVRIVSQLFAGNWPNFYGYTAWQSQFAWYS